jgi:hypothetical protein
MKNMVNLINLKFGSGFTQNINGLLPDNLINLKINTKNLNYKIETLPTTLKCLELMPYTNNINNIIDEKFISLINKCTFEEIN